MPRKKVNPRPFIKFKEVRQIVLDDTTKKPKTDPVTGKTVTVVAGYEPILRKGGLTEDILNNGNLEQLLEFKQSHKLNEEEGKYLDSLIHTANEVKRIGEETKAAIYEGIAPPKPEVEEKGGYIGFSDIKYPNVQTSAYGCWSCSYSLLLKSRGVDFSQEEIRAWRPDQSVSAPDITEGGKRKKKAALYRMNSDDENTLMDNADLLGQVLPNSCMSLVSLKPLGSQYALDGKEADMLSDDEKEVIQRSYDAQLKKAFRDTIRNAITIDRSPLAVTIDGHTVTITGISEDGESVRYEDSLKQNVEDCTNVITIDRLLEMGTKPHTDWWGHFAEPNGIDITWIKDIDLPEYEKRKTEKKPLYKDEPELVKLDDNGNVEVDVPLTHFSASVAGDPQAGQTEGKGVDDQVIFDTKEIEAALDGKKLTSFGPGGGYTMYHKETYYPSKVYFPKDPSLEHYRLATLSRKETRKILTDFYEFLESYGPIAENAQYPDKGWLKEIDKFSDAANKLTNYKPGKKRSISGEEALKALSVLKKFPDFLLSAENGKNVYQHMMANTYDIKKGDMLINLYNINKVLNLGIDLAKTTGLKKDELEPQDIRFKGEQRTRWSNAKGIVNESKFRYLRLQVLAEILAAEELRQNKLNAGFVHPDISDDEIKSSAGRILGSEVFKRLVANDRDIAFAAEADTAKFYSEFTKLRQEVLQEARAQKEKRIEEENRQKREIEEKARQEKERKDKEKERREQEEPKKEEPVKEAQKKEDSKKEGQKKEELVKEAQKKEDPKKEDRKKNEPVKEKQENPNRKTGKEAGDMQLIDEQKNERIAGIVGEELTAPADLGEREQADKSLMEKYDLGAITQGQWFGGSVMFGLLGNVLSDESKEKLYKDLSFFDVAKKDVEGAKAAYGRGYHGLLDMMDPAAEDPVDEAEYTETSNDAKIFINEKPSMFRHYTNIAFEKPLKNFDDAMKRLIKAIDKRLERGDFDSSGHEKYLRMMRGFAKDIVDGTFSQKMKSDPQYEYAYNMTAKIRNTAPSTEVVEGKFTPVLQENIDDIRNLRLLTPTGIIDSMAGAKRANEMLDIHLTTGDFTRDDLIAEYTQQQKRLEKALGISQEDFERISNTGAFDNKWEEFVADSDRGYGWALFDVGAKLQTLKAGYPVSDLSTFCAYARAIYDADKAVNEATEDLEAAKKEAKTSGKKTAEELKNMEGRLNRQKEILATMKRVWNEAVNVKNLTESERKRLISNMANALNEARFNIADNQYYKKGNALAVERAQAPLTGYEKAQLTGSSTVLYQLLKQVDPRTLSSSKQFVNLKKELKELARLQRETEDWDSVLGKAQYTEQLEKTMVAAAAYLKFKTKQYNEPGTSHKRSVREARRVRMVEAIFNGLRNQKFPATDIPVCEKNIKPLVTVTAESRQLGRIEKDKLPVSYDSYIRLHTGRAAANSTKEEMAAVVPKVLAAYMLKKEAEPQPFSLDRLNRHAKVVSERLGLSAMNEEELSDVLADPGRLGRNIKVITAENFGIDMPGAYERFVRGMKKLYKNLPAPEKDDAYARIFENVKKLAHLPAKSDGMDADKLAETIAATNCELVYSVKKLIEGHEKNIGDIEKHGLDVLGVIRGSSKPNTHVIGDFEKKLNKIRGTETYESDYYEKYGALVHIDLDDYNSLRYTTENPRELDRKLLEDAKKAYAMSSVQKAKQSFSANEEPAAPKTGSNPEIKDKKKHKVISKDFDNADVTGRKIKL